MSFYLTALEFIGYQRDLAAYQEEMMSLHSLLPLIGIPIIVIGFACRINPLLVVTFAGITTGLSTGLPFGDLLALFGEKFMTSRTLASFVLIFPVIALLEHFGLQQRAQQLISRFAAVTSGRILMAYFVMRETTAALGLNSLGGHAQTVRPLIAPMAVGAAINHYGELPIQVQDKIKAHAAACDNIAVFFGEDIFIAFGAVLLINAFLQENGIASIEPLHIGLWAIPTALAALIIHFARLLRLDKQIHQDMLAWQQQQEANRCKV